MHFYHWLIFGILNGLVIYVGAFLVPTEIVLGNAYVSVLATVVLTALVVTAVFSILPLIHKQTGLDKMNDTTKYIIYAVINIMTLWLLSRIATVFGFGLASKFTAISLGLVLTIVHYLYWETAVKKLKV
ncbi:hypothetical protein A2W14_03175 [Candidatus Gottesmanbacteria bacterium RBG_16_37_8]|uniref:Uncharacterized protein n=1 Tax=Candidatus Gottesmanbacteria bacterium RBG_16_37_8 TaxID=1798371 RepID=A0A1F5YTR7_9BACT|nr:MAG: hypothetical protein A2W14_03175 [Candidatus Gottesmanbacteria bacterium RBG_16_37_8]